MSVDLTFAHLRLLRRKLLKRDTLPKKAGLNVKLDSGNRSSATISMACLCVLETPTLRKQSYPCAILVCASEDFHKPYCVLVGARILRKMCLLHSTVIDILELLENSKKEEKYIVLFLLCIWHTLKITHYSSGKSSRDQ